MLHATIGLMLAQVFQTVAQTGQWGAQVMGDVVGGMAHAAEQIFDAIKHAIETLRDLIEGIIAVIQRRPQPQFTATDTRHRGI